MKHFLGGAAGLGFGFAAVAGNGKGDRGRERPHTGHEAVGHIRQSNKVKYSVGGYCGSIAKNQSFPRSLSEHLRPYLTPANTLFVPDSRLRQWYVMRVHNGTRVGINGRAPDGLRRQCRLPSFAPGEFTQPLLYSGDGASSTI